MWHFLKSVGKDYAYQGKDIHVRIQTDPVGRSLQQYTEDFAQ